MIDAIYTFTQLLRLITSLFMLFVIKCLLMRYKVINMHKHKYVIGFAKRGLPLTSNLQASTIHYLRCVKAMDLEIVQFTPLI